MKGPCRKKYVSTQIYTDACKHIVDFVRLYLCKKTEYSLLFYKISYGKIKKAIKRFFFVVHLPKLAYIYVDKQRRLNK